MNFSDKLLRHDKESVAINGITYGELLQAVNQAANLLTYKGINKGDALFLHGDDSVEMVVLWLAGIKVGAVLMLASMFHTASEIAKMKQAVKVKLSLVNEEIQQFIDESKDQLTVFNSVAVSPTAPAVIAFTSGTTGNSKKVVHSHEVLEFVVKDSMEYTCDPVKEDVFYCTAPLAFMYGLGGSLLVPLYYGSSVVVTRKLTPNEVLQVLDKHKVTVLLSSPMFYRAAATIGANLLKLRYCFSGGEYLHERIRSAWKAKHNKYITNVIGNTEVLWFYAASRDGITQEGFSGELLPGYTISIINDEIVIDSPFSTSFTGDKGILFGNSLFYIGRKDDVIISSGVNINPSEIEEILMESGLFDEVYVVKYSRFGTEFPQAIGVKAVAISDDEFVKAVRTYAKSRLPKIKQPKKVKVVKKLPRTFNGKAKRSAVCGA
jgi:2-aminobenzoate-CoA ligase